MFSLLFSGLPGGSDGKKKLSEVQETWVQIPGTGRSPAEGNGNPLQYSYLEKSMDRGAWQATVQGIAKSRTRLSDFHILWQFMSSLFFPWSVEHQVLLTVLIVLNN